MMHDVSGGTRSSLRVGLFATSDFVAMPPGGITTFVRTCASYAPEWVDLVLVGVDAQRGVRSECREISGRHFPFVSIGRMDDSSRIPVRLQAHFMMIRARRVIDALGIDVAYAHSPEIASLLSTTATPIVYHIHGGSTDMRYSKHAALRNPVGGLLFKSLVRRSIKRSRLVMGVNERCRELAHEQSKPYENAPPSVDTCLFNPVGRYVGNADVLRLGYVGRIDENKNVTFILSVAEHLQEMGLAVRLSIAGDGPEFELLRERVEASPVRDSVALHGALVHADTADLLHNVDVFMMASRVEGLPTALLEAMACGCVPVVPNLPGILEAVSNGATGIVYTDFDARAVAGRVKEAWQNREELSAAAAQHVLMNFSAQVSAERIFETLAVVAEARSAGRGR